MLVVSGNDAADTLADAGGGVPATVQAMNQEAARLNALDTRAVNANGLDAPGQVSSAYDLALIARAGMTQPDFRRYVATKHSSIPGPRGPISISSHDKLLYNYPGTIGIKNGYTVKAQATFVGAARRGDHTLVVVLLTTHPRYWPEAAALLDWGFAAERVRTPPVGELVGPGAATAVLEHSPLTNAGMHAGVAAGHVPGRSGGRSAADRGPGRWPAGGPGRPAAPTARCRAQAGRAALSRCSGPDGPGVLRSVSGAGRGRWVLLPVLVTCDRDCYFPRRCRLTAAAGADTPNPAQDAQCRRTRPGRSGGTIACGEPAAGRVFLG